VIALVDYGAGNLTSVKKALGAVGAEVFIPEGPEALADAGGVIVPGVGHFGATRVLGPAWTTGILDRLSEGRPLLGICLGMHWLFESSDEAPELAGLGVLPGVCVRLGSAVPLPAGLKVPHVGWNSLTLGRESWIADGVAEGAQVYFTHSYVAPVTGDAVALTEHGAPFAAIVQRGQVAGLQFHPEKSGDVGLRILRNFVEMAA
jgi:glutamine amidotransferase